MYLASRYFSRLCLLLCLLFLFSCKKDEVAPTYPAGSHAYINNWMLDSMQIYYYWNASLPKRIDLDQEPLTFFQHLKHPDDRFSRIYNPTLPASYYFSPAQHFGCEFLLYETEKGSAEAVISLVVPSSPAYRDGLYRGDVVLSINGVKPNRENIARLIQGAIIQRQLHLEIKGKHPFWLRASTIIDPGVHLFDTFKVGSKPVAYLFYNSFDARFKFPLTAAFSKFKYDGAQDLILDLRYNAGGDVAVCAALVAMLGNVHENDVFVEYRGNRLAGNRKDAFKKAISKIASGQAFNWKEIEELRMPLKRLYVLTGKHTASAAEYLIHALGPILPVIQIGETTLGKDMASFTLKDNQHQEANPWSMIPMVFKLYNSSGYGNYVNGLKPGIEIHELSQPLRAIGSLDDPLIQQALKQISGQATKARVRKPKSHPKILYDSREIMDLHSEFSLPANF